MNDAPVRTEFVCLGRDRDALVACVATAIGGERPVEVDPATLPRREHGKQEVGAWADKAVRMAAVLRLQDRAPGSALHPEDVVILQFAPRQHDTNPTVVVRRVRPVHNGAVSDVKGWDAEAQLAA